MFDDADDPFLTIQEAAELFRIKRRTLDNLRWQGLGPKFRRHGGRIVYRRSDLLAWSEERIATTTAQRRRRARSFLDDRTHDDRGSRDRPSQGGISLVGLERQSKRADRSLRGETPIAS